MGAGYCRNFAIKKSNSEFLAFIDSDDLWRKNKLKAQINFMIKKNYNFTYTHYYTINENNNLLKSVLTTKNV
jgi:teichuronic acid biosynthesis glycosyltransferase TuaG